jgi:hypothetical protein
MKISIFFITNGEIAKRSSFVWKLGAISSINL